MFGKMGRRFGRMGTLPDGPLELAFSTLITRLGLTTGCNLILDAGGSASWPGSGTKWLDRSGGGYDFFLDFNGTVTDSDPTFVGGVGALGPSAYWLFDGNDYFRYDSASETWMEAMHQDGALFTLMFWVYPVSTDPLYLWGEAVNSDTNIGVTVYIIQDTERAVCAVSKGSTGYALQAGGDNALPGLALNTWNCIFFAIDETTGKYQWQRNDTASTEVTGISYSSPSASAATNRPELMTAGGQNVPATSGTRLAGVMQWGRYLTVDERSKLYEFSRERFGV